MATTVTATEREAIAAALQLYIDGVSKGDAEKLKKGFDERAWMFGELGGQRYDVPVSELIAMVTAQPLDTGDGNFEARIVSIEQVGDVASATIEEDGAWGAISFTDFFTLSKIDGQWKIVNKTFAHTGGELPPH